MMKGNKSQNRALAPTEEWCFAVYVEDGLELDWKQVNEFGGNSDKRGKLYHYV